MNYKILAIMFGMFMLIGLVYAGLDFGTVASSFDAKNLDSKTKDDLTKYKVTEVKTNEMRCDKYCQNDLSMNKDRAVISSKINVIPYLKVEIKGKGWKITKLTKEQIQAKEKEAVENRLKMFLNIWAKQGVKK